MAQLILPNKFGFQPQYPAPIDRAGLGKGIQILFNPAVGPVDLSTGRVWTAGGGASVKVNSQGRGFDFSAAGDNYGYTGYPEIVSNVGTFFMWCPVVGAQDTNGHVYFGASSPNVCGHQVNQNGSIIIGTGTSASSGALSSWFNTANRSLVLVSDGTAAGCKAFVDGVDTGFFWGNPPTSWGAGSKNFNFGRYVGASGFQFTGSILSLGNTSAVWGAAEAKAYHESKGNALFKAPARRLWAVSAGGVTLIGANSVEANTGGTGAISQIQILTGSPSSQANATSTGSISQGLALTGSPSAQSNASSTGAITQTHVLVVANSSQINAASAGAITSGINLAIASSVQGNASAAAAITQVHILIGAGGSQINAGSTGALSGANTLIGAMGTQSNASSAGMIFEVYIPPLPDGFVYLSVASTDF